MIFYVISWFSNDVRLINKSYLNKYGVVVMAHKGKLSDKDWALAFFLSYKNKKYAS